MAASPFLRPRALAGLFGAVLLGALAWLFAPLLGEAFDGIALRLPLALLPVLLWAGAVFWLARRGARRDAALAEAAVAPDPTAGSVREEEAELRERLTTALARLRGAVGARGHLYEQPWYVIIGPPGAGKTTAIARSGLRFPLAEGMRLGGAGGTRYCDWWLSEEAVLIDTAGRYTTQDSDAAVDRGAWERFLALLAQHRPRQPLNGVLVAFGVDQIARSSPAERDAHARAVRRRIRELEEALRQRLPVYVLVTKADLLAGFVEYFADLDAEARAQVWGMTLAPEAGGTEGPAEGFAGEFAALVERLNARLLDRLQAERGAEQRAAIAGFPAQVASLQEPISAFLRVAFGGSRLDPAPFLRGVYLTSGTQEGRPMDRLSGALARAFGLATEPVAAAAGAGRQERSFFLGRLLREVVFNEAQLASRDAGRERRRVALAATAWGAAALLLLGGGAWGWSAVRAEESRAARYAAALGAAEAAVASRPLDRIAAADGGSDLPAALPYLDAARALAPAAAGEGAGLGLGQDGKLGAAADLAYRRALERVLLPRLLTRLEAQMRAGSQRPEFLYEATRVYLMLGRQGPLDPSLIRAWLAADWERALPGATAAPLRTALLDHVDALLAGGEFAAYPLDGALVDQARRIFSRLPLADRVYARLRRLAESAPPWRPAEALGAAGQRLFVRAGGRPLTEPMVPGIYTVEGLHRVVLPALPAAVREAASESWVLGPEAGLRPGDAGDQTARLEAAVLNAYAEDYARAWQGAVAELGVQRFRGLREAADGLNVLGAPTSPMRDLLREIARQVSPAAASPERGAAAQAAQAAAQATAAASQAAQRVAAAVGSGGAGPQAAAEVVGRVVGDRFRPLREAVNGPAMEEALRLVSEVYELAARLASAPPGTALPPTPGLSPTQRLTAFAVRQPEPLAGWLRTLAETVGGLQLGGARERLAAAGAQQLAPVCRPGLEQRFPFRREATQDVPADDFVRLFAPGGALDQFFQQQLRPYVDTSRRPWRPAAVEGPPPVSAADVGQFERAAAIREAFFPGVAGSGFRFELAPVSLDGGATAGTLEVEGIPYPLAPRAGAGGAGRVALLQWPSRGTVALSFEPPSSAGPLAVDGAWSALRFVLQRGRLQPAASPDRFRLTVAHGDRTAVFELRVGSSTHPFGLRDLLAEFRCPGLAAP